MSWKVHLTRCLLLVTVAVLSAVIGAVLGGQMHHPGASAENMPEWHNKSMYDRSTPGISADVPERFCVRDFTDDPNFVASQWQATIAQWLNDPGGWEAIGTRKVGFVSSCSSPNIYIDSPENRWHLKRRAVGFGPHPDLRSPLSRRRERGRG